ncbi:MAG: alpha/beta hydrolase [Chloroflexi bacterium]|nr:alpha/beta hydrolase [Chloroflexota bacterium]
MTSSQYPEDKWVRVNDLNVHYLDWGGDGTKPPLVLMHGIGGHAHMFDDLAPLMSDRWHVYALDARGCGDSDWSREGYSAQAFASDVAAFVQKLGIFPFSYYGHSQGSRIGMALGAYYGHMVDHLVLGDYGPLPDPSPHGRETAERRQQEGLAGRPKGFFTPQMAFEWHKENGPEMSADGIWDLIRHTYRTNWDGILVPKTDPEISWLMGRTALKEGPFLWDCVGRISCKTLVLRGENSTVLDRKQADKIAATIPDENGIVEEVPGAGHGLHNDNLDDTVRIIRRFLEI